MDLHGWRRRITARTRTRTRHQHRTRLRRCLRMFNMPHLCRKRHGSNQRLNRRRRRPRRRSPRHPTQFTTRLPVRNQRHAADRRARPVMEPQRRERSPALAPPAGGRARSFTLSVSTLRRRCWCRRARGLLQRAERRARWSRFGRGRRRSSETRAARAD